MKTGKFRRGSVAAISEESPFLTVGHSPPVECNLWHVAIAFNS